MCILFNQIRLNKEMLPKYTHTHIYIYIYIYIELSNGKESNNMEKN